MTEIREMIISKKFRNWLYPVCLAAIALSLGYEFITEQDAVLWGALVAAALGLGTASAHIVDDDKVFEHRDRKRGYEHVHTEGDVTIDDGYADLEEDFELDENDR